MSGDSTGERNPFAPPPADAPDQPWQPRLPTAAPPNPPQEGEGSDEQPQVPPPHPWSPGYRGGWSPPQPAPKFDPNDPAQRRARYALSAGVGGLFCLLLGIFYVSLLLGALAVYWAVSSLRAGRTGAVAPAGPQPSQPQAPAALSGLFTGAVAVLFTLGWFGTLIYYNDYVVCVQDSPTAEASHSCRTSDPAPTWVVALLDPESL
ncbi:hypothetical protein AB0K43_04495 [Kitasatospora sp. NPDC049258]|uniref:hypothetical protein n=1 Tax=Kitasatospora sp. NPDC049258 TaxID=3155394 RepID=UPI0034343146